MALKIVTDGEVMRKAQEQIIQAFRHENAQEMATVITFPSGSLSTNIYWAEHLGIWFAPDEIKNSRYLNAFGTQSPRQTGHVPISCEINFPLAGIKRLVRGAVGEDETGQLFLLHRGFFNGISRELFEMHFDGQPSIVIDGDQESHVFVISPLASPTLLRQIQFFVLEVGRIKSLCKTPDADQGTQTNQ